MHEMRTRCLTSYKEKNKAQVNNDSRYDLKEDPNAINGPKIIYRIIPRNRNVTLIIIYNFQHLIIPRSL